MKAFLCIIKRLKSDQSAATIYQSYASQPSKGSSKSSATWFYSKEGSLYLLKDSPLG